MGYFARVLVVTSILASANTLALPIGAGDILTINGRDWAQPDLFSGVEWRAANFDCRGGPCGTGTLNGFDMQGWVWADFTDVVELFSHYLGPIDPGLPVFDNWQFLDAGGVALEAMLADGWRPTDGNCTDARQRSCSLNAMVSDDLIISPLFPRLVVQLGWSSRCSATGCDDATWQHSTAVESITPFEQRGAWFYRADHAVGVSAPATYGLMLTAFALAAWVRRYRQN